MKRIKEIGFHGTVRYYEKYKISELEEFIKFCLMNASKSGAHSVVTEICNYLKNHDHKMISNVLHHKDEYGKTALYYANKNYQLRIGLDLISLERLAHANDRGKALYCIRKEAGYYNLDLWYMDTYKIMHPPEKTSSIFKVILAVLFTVIPSIIFIYLFFALDNALSMQYVGLADGEVNQTNCPAQRSYESCFKEALGNNSIVQVDKVAAILKNILSNGTCVDVVESSPCEDTDYESFEMKTGLAFVIMMLTIFVWVWFYIFRMSSWASEFSNIKNRFARVIAEIIKKIFYYAYEEYYYRVRGKYDEDESADRTSVKEKRKEEKAEKEIISLTLTGKWMKSGNHSLL